MYTMKPSNVGHTAAYRRDFSGLKNILVFDSMALIDIHHEYEFIIICLLIKNTLIDHVSTRTG